MPIYRRGETWYCDIAHNGRRIRESLGTADKAEAQRKHDELRAKLWREAAAPHRRPLKDAARAWLEDGQRSDKEAYRLRRILEMLGDDPIDSIAADTVASAFAGQSPGNYNRNRALLVALLNTARLRGWIADVPHLPTRKAAEPRIRFLSAAEWQRLLAELPDHLKPLARFAVATGLRRHNVTHLEWGQVDLGRRVAWIHPDQSKSGKPIGVPMSDDAVSVLRGQLGQHERWVFPTRKIGRKRDGDQQGAPQEQITKGWKAALKRAGIEQTFRWHDLRHTWASWHVMSGTPLEVLQKLGGWSSLTMVMRYAHLAPDHLAGFANNSKPYGDREEKCA